jgi:RNA polymerase sigma-70 factor (ECF subfamily)
VIGAAFPSVLAAAGAGDERAFALLWREVQPGLLRYLQVVAPGAAEDLASETWVDVVRSLDRFHGDEQRFRSWTFTIARHRATDHRRRAGRRSAEPLPHEALPERPAADDPAAAAIEHLATERALALIAGLPPDQAEVVALRVVAGLEVGEVARIVGKRPGAVRVLAHRGLRRLAERLRAGPPAQPGQSTQAGVTP